MILTEDQRKARTKKLVSAARAVLSGQVGITVGAIRISNKLSSLGKEWEHRYPVFENYLSVLPPDLPVGNERLLWNPDKVLESDVELARIEGQHRPGILQACVEIVNNHSQRGAAAARQGGLHG